jgi:lactate permease
VLGSAGKPVSATTFSLNIFSAGGTVLLVSGLHPRRLVRAFADVAVQFRWKILTVVLVLALAYVMHLSGQTVTLGLALAATGGFFAFLSPVVGRLGVAVTGSDTSANSLFGLLQTTAAARTGISPVLLAAANTSGGVIGAAVVGFTGRESEVFHKVVGWSLVLLLGMSLLVFLQSTPVLGWMVVAR